MNWYKRYFSRILLTILLVTEVCFFVIKADEYVEVVSLVSADGTQTAYTKESLQRVESIAKNVFCAKTVLQNRSIMKKTRSMQSIKRLLLFFIPSAGISAASVQNSGFFHAREQIVFVSYLKILMQFIHDQDGKKDLLICRKKEFLQGK